MKFTTKKSILFIAFVFASFFAQAAVIAPLAGTTCEAGNNIEWSVDVVEDVQFFIIQRSNDGVHYFPVATVNTSENLEYSFFDKKITGKTAFYRVVKVGANGVGDFSTSIQLN